MTIEESVRQKIGLVALRRLPNDYPDGTGEMFDEMARELAECIERSWAEAHNEGCVGSERRGPIEDFGELDPIIAAQILAAFRGDET